MAVLVKCVIISLSLMVGLKPHFFCFEIFMEGGSFVRKLSQGDFIPFKDIKSVRVYGEAGLQNQAFIQAVFLMSIFEQRFTHPPQVPQSDAPWWLPWLINLLKLPPRSINESITAQVIKRFYPR